MLSFPSHSILHSALETMSLNNSRISQSILHPGGAPMPSVDLQCTIYTHSTVGCYDPRTLLDVVLKEKVFMAVDPWRSVRRHFSLQH